MGWLGFETWEWTLFAQVLTCGVILFVCIYTNSKNNIREKRKEIRSLIDNIQDMLNSIEEQALKYHTNKKESKQLAFELKRDLDVSLGTNFEILKSREFEIGTCDPFYAEFRVAIASPNFEEGKFKPLDFSAEILLGIRISKDELSKEIERCFSSKYK